MPRDVPCPQHKVIELLDELGPVEQRRVESGLLELDIKLPVSLAPDGPLNRALRGAAAGHLTVRPPGPVIAARSAKKQ